MQEINLYLADLQPKKLSFSANFALAASIALIVVFTGIQIVAENSLKQLNINVATIENQKVATSERLLKIKSTSLTSNAVLLDQSINDLRAQISDRQTVGKIIEWQNLGNEDGFAHVLESLARHSSNEFSLQRIRLGSGGKSLELAGDTLRAETIPLYLQALQTEDGLAHTRFGLLSMGGDKKIKKFSLGFETVYKLAGEKDKR